MRRRGRIRRRPRDHDADVLEPWVKAQPPGAARQAAIRSLLESQIRNAPERIDTLADTWPAGTDRDAAMRGIASSLSQSDPRRALDFARRIASPSAREASFEGVAQSWFYQDATAARSWIASAQEFTSEQKRVLLRQFDER